MKITVLVPVGPKLRPEILEKAEGCARLARAESGHELQFRWWNGVCLGADRIERLAAARNTMLAAAAGDGADMYAFVDADVFYAPDTFDRLQLTGRDVVAPAVMVEDQEDRFYDTAGFQGLTGRHFGHQAPYLRDHHFERAACLSVGTFYVFPAWLAETPGRYAAQPGPVEHQAFCASARRDGVAVYCDFGVRVFHANLPKYGERWH